ncbi:hypothetical protein Ae331Ps2_6004c [Pseudonocardia sp. Ae331_Ps2]|nr:hypothetical protein Ae331Ps2_6004c [Pseudonocardia sp. Ae331_Ps2]
MDHARDFRGAEFLVLLTTPQCCLFCDGVLNW